MPDRSNQETPGALTLMEMKARALFTFDALGRMVTENERDPERAPRFFLGRTVAGRLWFVRDDLPPEAVAEIAGILADEPPLGDPRRRPASFDALCAALAIDAPLDTIWEGPAWHFPATIPAPTGVVALTPDNFELVREYFPYAVQYLSERDPGFVVVEDGIAVSICFSTRAGAEAAEAGVHTVDDFRGLGYAAKVAAAWAHAVRAGGRVPLYSTSWDNVASQAVARKLGLVLYGVQLSLG